MAGSASARKTRTSLPPSTRNSRPISAPRAPRLGDADRLWQGLPADQDDGAALQREVGQQGPVQSRDCEEQRLFDKRSGEAIHASGWTGLLRLRLAMTKDRKAGRRRGGRAG